MECYTKPIELTQEQITKFESLYLKPGDFCGHGFIDENDKLIDIYNNDMETLSKYNITTKQISDILTTITEKYDRKFKLIRGDSMSNAEFSPEIMKHHYKELSQLDKNLFSERCNSGYSWRKINVINTNPIIIDNKYLITRISYWGYQACPFVYFSETVDRTLGGGDDYWIYDLETKKTLQFNDMLIHLIRDHHFFEGNVSHRLDPIDVINFFDLKPNVDYSPNFIEVNRWIRVVEGGDISGCNNFGSTNEVTINHESENIITISCTQRTYSQKEPDYILKKFIKNQQELVLEELATIKHKEYVFCETIIDNLPIRHRLDLKRVSIYEKQKVKFIPIAEEKLYSQKIYTDKIIYTTFPKNSYFEPSLINGELNLVDKYIKKTLFDEIEENLTLKL